MCPGKNMATGRDGKAYARDIGQDVQVYASTHGIKLIICLLNDYEIRSIGCDVKKYERACQQHGIELMKYPIIEMAPPEDVAQFHADVVAKVLESMRQGHNVLAHCRGGIGRAGLLACCVSYCLLGTGPSPQVKTPKDVIAHVRSKRDRRCVESRKQEERATNSNLSIQRKNQLAYKNLIANLSNSNQSSHLKNRQ